MPELLILVEQTDKGDFVARTADGSIFAQAATYRELENSVIQSVGAHLKGAGPIKIRLQLGKVSTSLLIEYMAALYAWLLEICLVLFHVFGQQKPDVVVHAVLLGAMVLLTAIAWRRRHELKALRGVIGRTPLSGVQMTAVVIFVLLVGGLFTWVANSIN
jgi:hypothetical protein